MQQGSKGCGATNNRITYVEDYSQQGAAGVMVKPKMVLSPPKGLINLLVWQRLGVMPWMV